MVNLILCIQNSRQICTKANTETYSSLSIHFLNVGNVLKMKGDYEKGKLFFCWKKCVVRLGDYVAAFD